MNSIESPQILCLLGHQTWKFRCQPSNRIKQTGISLPSWYASTTATNLSVISTHVLTFHYLWCRISESHHTLLDDNCHLSPHSLILQLLPNTNPSEHISKWSNTYTPAHLDSIIQATSADSCTIK